MPKKMTQQEFIERCKNIHKNKYDYSKVIYNNNLSKIIIICPVHGEFAQKKFKGLQDIKNLSYDFYLPNQKTVIEFNGEQHYKHNNFFHRHGRSLAKQQYHDSLKIDFARRNKLKMLSIPYKDLDKIESILKRSTDKTNYTRLKLFSDKHGNIYFQIECKYEREDRQAKSKELAKVLMNKLLQDKNIKAKELQ